MDPGTPAESVAELLNDFTRGHYLILLEAVRQLGGELRLDRAAIEAAAAGPLVPMEVDGTDGPVVLRIDSTRGPSQSRPL
jgi:hypothetical protein